MMLSRTCQHAIWVMAVLAKRWASGNRGWAKAKEIADVVGLPVPMTAKVLQQLAHAGLLTSSRGQKGGFKLRRMPESITLAEIVGAVDGAESLSGCVLGLPQCDDRHPCPLHAHWAKIRQPLLQFLATVRLSDILPAIAIPSGKA
jgi:Rrf2 family iron-sulfur cluster assembly transcriptional regulator